MLIVDFCKMIYDSGSVSLRRGMAKTERDVVSSFLVWIKIQVLGILLKSIPVVYLNNFKKDNC